MRRAAPFIVVAAACAAGFVCGAEGLGDRCLAWCERQAECRGFSDENVQSCRGWCGALGDDCRDAYFECIDRDPCEAFVTCEDQVRVSFACAQD